MYSKEEKIWWIQKHNAGYSFRDICNVFHETYPLRPKPYHTTVMRCYERFMRTGCVEFHRTGSHPQRQTSLNEIVALAAVHADPTASTTTQARRTGLSQSTVMRTLKKHKYRPYKISEHQELRPQDKENRRIFASHALELSEEDPDLFRNILFTDESSFTLNHGPNRQNTRVWSQTIPYESYASHTQYPRKVNLWAGIINGMLLGPVVIDGNLTGEKYVQLLQTEVADRLTDLDVNAAIWYQHDGCPAHNYGPARHFLHRAFPGRVIGSNEQPLAWPPRSPDLNPLDFFLWGHITSTIYRREPFPNVESLLTAIHHCCDNITHRQLASVTKDFSDRLHYTVAADGGLFEPFL